MPGRAHVDVPSLLPRSLSNHASLTTYLLALSRGPYLSFFRPHTPGSASSEPVSGLYLLRPGPLSTGPASSVELTIRLTLPYPYPVLTQIKPPLPFILGTEFAGVVAKDAVIPKGCAFKAGGTSYEQRRARGRRQTVRAPKLTRTASLCCWSVCNPA